MNCCDLNMRRMCSALYFYSSTRFFFSENLKFKMCVTFMFEFRNVCQWIRILQLERTFNLSCNWWPFKLVEGLSFQLWCYLSQLVSPWSLRKWRVKDRDQSLIVKLYVDRTYALCQHKRRFLSLLFVESTELTL